MAAPELTAEERGTPGASARAEGERRSAKRAARIRTKHPRIGGAILALTSDPTSTTVWAQGAVGEERVGALLEESRGRGLEVLHDRKVPRSRANLDHLVIAPTGLWVVDPKRYLSGKLEQREAGTRRAPDPRLYVGGRDRSKLISTMQWQIDQTRAALARTAFEDVEVRGALCFVDVELGWFAKPFTIDGVLVTWRKLLVSSLLGDPDDPPAMDAGQRASMARHLAAVFKPAWTPPS